MSISCDFSRIGNAVATALHSSVPNEIVLSILSYVDCQTLCRLRAVHPSWCLSIFASHDSLWEEPLEELIDSHRYHLPYACEGIEDPTIDDIDAELKADFCDYGPRVIDKVIKIGHLLACPVETDWAKTAQAAFFGHERRNEILDFRTLFQLQEEKLGSDCFHYVALLGDGATGKTSLLYKVVRGHFCPRYAPTFFDNMLVRVQFDQFGMCGVNLWDTKGVQGARWPGLMTTERHCSVLCYDCCNRQSFENVKLRWWDKAFQYSMRTEFVLCATKIDLRKLAQVGDPPITREEGIALARELKIKFFIETSAKTGETTTFFPAVAAASLVSRFGARFTTRKPKCSIM